MSLTVTGKARLVTDPKRGRTGAGKPWANAVLRVVNYRKTDGGWEEHSSFSCTAVAFEDAAFKLAGFSKGDEVEFTGRVRELKVWTPERGEPRAQLGLSLDEVTAAPKRSGVGRGQADASAARIRAMTYTRSQLDEMPPQGGPRSDTRPVSRTQAEPGTAADAPRGNAPVDLAAYRNGTTQLRRAHANNPRTTGRPA